MDATKGNRKPLLLLVNEDDEATESEASKYK